LGGEDGEIVTEDRAWGMRIDFVTCWMFSVGVCWLSSVCLPALGCSYLSFSFSPAAAAALSVIPAAAAVLSVVAGVGELVVVVGEIVGEVG
jgi:hypothetical protein